MASAARGSDRCPSGKNGTTPVSRRCKKPSAFHRAALCYLEKRIQRMCGKGRGVSV